VSHGLRAVELRHSTIDPVQLEASNDNLDAPGRG
jgi:hypothetical protein